MKTNILTLLLAFLTVAATAQTLTLGELQTLCKLSNWETGANTLTRKGWEYHDSKRGDSYEYSTITYAHSKDAWYDDRAAAWFNFFTYNNRVERITYQPTDNAFKAIKASLAANGYKQIDSEIYDNYLSTTYSSPSFILEIQTSTQERAYYGGTSVSYLIGIIRKGGIYDDDNGEKTDYYYGTSTVKARYTLKDVKKNGKCYSYYSNGNLESVINYVNGKGNGPYTVYYEDGTIKMSGSLFNGEKNGQFIEYDEYGDKNFEYIIKNGKLNGKFIAYHGNGKIRATGTYLNNEKEGLVTEYDTDGRKVTEIYYKNGEKNGSCVFYAYNNDGGLKCKETGTYLNDEKNGLWQLQLHQDGNFKTLTYRNYSNGTLHGAAKEWDGGDSIVFCNYNYGKLDGKYQEKRVILGLANVQTVDDEELITVTDGYYANGKKSGYWTYTNLLMQPEAEGKFVNDDKEGEWKYYYINNHLDCIANYHLGKLEGKLTKFKKELMLNSLDSSFIEHNPIMDSIDYICYYTNGKRNGHYEQHDNDGNIISSGEYFYDKRNGRWTDVDTAEGVKYCYNYKNGEPDGLCEEFSYSSGRKRYSYNYNNGVMDGTQTWYKLDGNKPFAEDVFRNGVLQNHTLYSKDGAFKIRDFKLITTTYNTFYGTELSYYTEMENPSIDRISIDFWYGMHPDSVLKTPFYFELITAKANKTEHGKIQVFDRQNRTVTDGQYDNGRPKGNWTFTYYDQNLYYIENKDDSSKPMLFYTLNGEPYSGKFTREEEKNSEKVTAVYKIKKSLIEEIVYQNPQTGKTISKEKFKDGIKP